MYIYVYIIHTPDKAAWMGSTAVVRLRSRMDACYTCERRFPYTSSGDRRWRGKQATIRWRSRPGLSVSESTRSRIHAAGLKPCMK